MIAQWGGLPRDLGILPDRPDAIAALAKEKCDLLVTLGGASVGDHDLVQSALGPKGFALDFWKIAMRPGKPLIFGRLGATPFLGLPGNPVSTLVCAHPVPASRHRRDAGPKNIRAAQAGAPCRHAPGQ